MLEVECSTLIEGEALQGIIRPDGSGLATFNVQYTCISMRLWPEEVVDAEVEQVTAYGLRCKVGPFRIFVSEKA
jgi:DNA-directed RNA polymerase subunit E'/Rpb7